MRKCSVCVLCISITDKQTRYSWFLERLVISFTCNLLVCFVLLSPYLYGVCTHFPQLSSEVYLRILASLRIRRSGSFLGLQFLLQIRGQEEAVNCERQAMWDSLDTNNACMLRRLGISWLWEIVLIQVLSSNSIFWHWQCSYFSKIMQVFMLQSPTKNLNIHFPYIPQSQLIRSL